MGSLRFPDEDHFHSWQSGRAAVHSLVGSAYCAGEAAFDHVPLASKNVNDVERLE